MAEQQQTPGFDSAQLAQTYAEIARRSQQLVTDFLARQATGEAPAVRDELGIAKAFFEMYSRLLAQPAQLAEMQVKLWQDYAALWQNTWLNMMGQPTRPVAEPAHGDRRFKHDDWQNNFLFDYIKQSYLIAARHLHQAVAGVQGLDEQTAKKVDFYTRQFIDAMEK